jgi:hypothetical protein
MAARNCLQDIPRTHSTGPPFGISGFGRKRRDLITRHGRPGGVLVGFASEDEWFDYRLEDHPKFLARVEACKI